MYAISVGDLITRPSSTVPLPSTKVTPGRRLARRSRSATVTDLYHGDHQLLPGVHATAPLPRCSVLASRYTIPRSTRSSPPPAATQCCPDRFTNVHDDSR